jgi:hypothetical protein
MPPGGDPIRRLMKEALMKVASLVFMAVDGSVGSIAGQNLDPLMAIAKKARITGLIEKTPITEGVVMCNWKALPPYQFKVEADVVKTKKSKSKE